MPVLNEGDRIRRAITSLERQTHAIDRLVVVDGGSTDSTHETVEATASDTEFDVELLVLEGAGVRYSSQVGAEAAASRLLDDLGDREGVVLRLEGDSALEETFVETAVERLADPDCSVFGAAVQPHEPDVHRLCKRLFTLAQNAEQLPKGRGMAFRARDFRAVDGYRLDADEDVASSPIDCLEDGILVAKLCRRGAVAFSHDTCVYSSVPSTTATSPSRWLVALHIEREMGPTHYFTRIANPVNTVLYAARRVVGRYSAP